MPYSESQFVELVAEAGDFEKKEVKAFFDAFEDAILSVVGQADKAKIPGLGTLNCSVREARKARNPATGETIMTKPKIALRFSIEKPLKDAVPSIKKGRALIEQRESEKASAKKKTTRKSKTSTTGKRGPGRPKGTEGTTKRKPGRPKSSGTKVVKTEKGKAKRGRPKSKRRI